MATSREPHQPTNHGGTPTVLPRPDFRFPGKGGQVPRLPGARRSAKGAGR
jgi:hypothetical protein